MNTLFFACLSIAFIPSHIDCFVPWTPSTSKSYHAITNARNDISTGTVTSTSTSTTPCSTTAAFAFPDSRKHASQEKLRQNKTRNKSNQQRQYKNVENEDDASEQDLSSIKGQQENRPQRKFRSSNVANKYANNNSNSDRNRNSYSKDRPIFTKTLIAPPLEKSVDESEEENLVVSPSVTQTNKQECMTYICGELPVTYTNDPNTLERWLIEHCTTDNDNIHSVLGFDVEAAPSLPWRKPTNWEFIDRPATVQLSTPYASIVVHLTKRPDRYRARSVLSPLIAMLSDETILKVGVGINEDMLELYRWNKNLDAKGRFDIGGIGSDSNRSRVGLQKLVRAIIGVELLKSKKTAMSDWSRIPLSTKQLSYASRDAWAGAAVMENIGKMNAEMSVDNIAALAKERERDMEDVDMRARTRKKTRLETKEIMDEMKSMSSYLQGSEKMNGRERHEHLMQIMPDATKAEMRRLQKILDETAPDDLIFFEADKLGLDFTFSK